MCYLTQVLYHKCKHQITTQTHCSDETSPWHSIQYASFSSIIREYDFCNECQKQGITTLSRLNDPYDLPPSYRTQPVQSCLRPDGSIETYQDIMQRKQREAEARKVQIHVHPELDPLSTPRWLQQARSRKAMFEKIRERRTEDEERMKQSIKAQLEFDRSQEAIKGPISDSGYASEASNEAAEAKDVPPSEDSAEAESESETIVHEGFGGLTPVRASSWTHQRQSTTGKLKERKQWERWRRQRDQKPS